ncbi:putative prolyl 4-hydroxylase 12 [Silene latifolia]|uniref:putative prolyl 4-hydroxylase 12 n=1 Tax=Silene latifolia TaxID=37657 RepID=UPI003D7769C2
MVGDGAGLDPSRNPRSSGVVGVWDGQFLVVCHGGGGGFGGDLAFEGRSTGFEEVFGGSCARGYHIRKDTILWVIPLMATVILSLSNTSRGGEISFPESQIKTSGLKSKLWPYSVSRNNLLKPVKGNAILFFNVHPNASPDKRSLHERNPVTEGGMWSAVKVFYLRAVSGITAPTDHENSDCTDEDESCSKWAALGECQRNAVFMVGSPDYYGTCRKSCKVC